MIEKNPEDETFTEMQNELRDVHDVPHEVMLVIATYCGKMNVDAWSRGYDDGWKRAKKAISKAMERV